MSHEGADQVIEDESIAVSRRALLQRSGLVLGVPPPYRSKLATPVVFGLGSFDGAGQSIQIAAGRMYASMNFDQQVPAPTLRVTEGDTVRFALTNRGAVPHSIDFHAAQTSWSRTIRPSLQASR